MSVTVHHGDCLDVLRGMGEASVDSVVCDPPYGLEFMGKEWDKLDGYSGGNPNIKPRDKHIRATGDGEWQPGRTYGAPKRNPRCRRCGKLQRGNGACKCAVADWDTRHAEQGFRMQVWHEAWAREVYRVMKPGAHLVAFGGTRTGHRLACAIEDAGFEIRDQLAWLYGSGFPKSHNLPGGWGTALKPAHEPIVLARKPLACPTVAAQVLATGTGALNIGATRINPGEPVRGGGNGKANNGGRYGGGAGTNGERPRVEPHAAGRWPANLLTDGSPEVLAAFEKFATHGAGAARQKDVTSAYDASSYHAPVTRQMNRFGDEGSPARFFYSAKASKAERAGSRHPTVKPLALMRWLCRLVTPPGGTVLDCFAGTGVTGEAAMLEGFGAVLVEREAEHVADCHRRLGRASGADTPLLSETAA